MTKDNCMLKSTISPLLVAAISLVDFLLTRWECFIDSEVLFLMNPFYQSTWFYILRCGVILK